MALTGPEISCALSEMGLDHIAVVDDAPENLEAAQSFLESMEGISLELYERGDLFLEAVKSSVSRAQLVLTDLRMETSEAGINVAVECWRRYILTYVCSSVDENTSNLIRVSPGVSGLTIEGGKSDPETWKQIVEYLIENKVMNRWAKFAKDDQMTKGEAQDGRLSTLNEFYIRFDFQDEVPFPEGYAAPHQL